MRVLLTCGILFCAAIFVGTTFVESSEAQAEAARYFSSAEIHNGLVRSFQRRLLFWAGEGVRLAVLAWLIGSGFSRRLADMCSSFFRGYWLPSLLAVGGVLFLLDEAIALPLGIAGLENLRAWELTQRSTADWLYDHFLRLGITAVLQTMMLVGLYLLIRGFPRMWWLPAGFGGAILGIAAAYFLPVVVAPLFNTFTPLADHPEWSCLQRPIRDLAAKAHIPLQEILVMNASRQGRHTNAYFTGFGVTRRIVLYDTLLQAHSRPGPAIVTGIIGVMPLGPWQASVLLAAKRTEGQYEIESVLAHEIGHWQNNHIVKGIVLGTAGALVGFFVLAWLLKRFRGQPPLYLRSAHDPAGVPLVVFLTMIGAWLAAPVQNAVSRQFEREADAASLEWAGRPDVFIAAEKRLARDNIGHVAPSPWLVCFFATHPPAVERIHMAEDWRSHGKRIRP
jgi:STE24 endopeptidase